MNKYIIKIDRFFAWVLYFSMLAYFISGYGMTKGVIDAKFGSYLHSDLLPYFIVIAFLFHTGYAIHIAFKRWRIWNNLSGALLIIIYLSLFGLFIYVESVYIERNINKETNVDKRSVNEEVSSPSSQALPSQTSESNKSENYFTVDELAKYNGEDGMPAYVAVDGIIYDMSTVFVTGTHYSHMAGTELTDEFYIRHVSSEITKYPVVGKLK